MLRKLTWLFVVLPASIVLIALAVANRHMVRLNLDPFSEAFPVLAFDAPLFLLLIAALLVGLFIGGTLTWLKQGRWRRAARENGRDVNSLRAINRQLDERLKTASAQPIEAGE